MADFNPYQAPSAHVEDIKNDAEYELADRSTRLVASIIDTIILIVIAVLLAFVFLPNIFSDPQQFGLTSKILILACTWTIWLTVNFSWLRNNGQTIGKKIFGIKIVRLNNEKCSFARIAGRRFLIPGLISQIAFLGPIFALIDYLFIFQESRRCVHDLIADTIVVVA